MKKSLLAVALAQPPTFGATQSEMINSTTTTSNGGGSGGAQAIQPQDAQAWPNNDG